jgi:hypothetical protein
MKVYSHQQIAKFFVGFAIIIWILILLLIVVNHSVSCVDRNGCLRSFCEFRWLQQTYKDLVRASKDNCFYKDLTVTFFEDNPNQ